MSDKEKPSTRWSELRDMFAATREAMIVTAVVLVFVAPSIVRGSLERAGISSFAGVEFGVKEVVEANETVAAAEDQFAKITSQLSEMESKLVAMTASGRDAKPEEIRRIASDVSSMRSQARSVGNSLHKTGIKIDKAVKLISPEQLRELSKQNAQRADFSQQQQSISIPPIQSAQLEGLLIQPTEFPPQGISR